MNLSWRTRFGLLLALGFAAFLVRAYHPLSRPPQWLVRSDAFMHALAFDDWAHTYQSRHPGVTVMVISGVTVHLFDTVRNTPAEVLFSWAIPSFATNFGQRMAAGVIGLSAVMAALIVAAVWCLQRLSNWAVALTAGALMAFSPFYLAMGRAYHVDALIAGFMILSALLLLLYLRQGRKRYLISSGLVAGLAILTKSPALFLIPFAGLALLAYLVPLIREAWREPGSSRRQRLVAVAGRRLVAPFLVWLACLLLPFAFWPAMWVDAPDVLVAMYSGALEHIEEPHVVPRFFAGEIIAGESPGWTYYPLMMIYHSTFITTTLVLVAFWHYGIRGRARKRPLPPIDFWLLVSFALFFTIQMMLGAKKADRYIVPVHLAFNILAAVGLGSTIELGRQALLQRFEQPPSWFVPTMVVLVTGLQAVPTLAYAPDYGAFRNHLLGGNKGALNVISVMGQNEGVIDIGRYLDQQPDASSKHVGVTYPLDFSLPQYFEGKVTLELPPEADYHLFSYVTMQRQLFNDVWRPVWEDHQKQSPLLIVSYDGVDYLWLYANKPSLDAAETIRINRGGQGYVIVAWLWTLALVGGHIWASRRHSPRRHTVLV